MKCARRMFPKSIKNHYHEVNIFISLTQIKQKQSLPSFRIKMSNILLAEQISLITLLTFN